MSKTAAEWREWTDEIAEHIGSHTPWDEIIADLSACERLRDAYSKAKTENDDRALIDMARLRIRAESAERRLSDLIAAFERHSEHMASCARVFDDAAECDCGLAAALRAAKGEV